MHLYTLVMLGELATGVDRYTLIVWAHISETGTELDIMEPYYEEPFMSSTTQWTGVICSYHLALTIILAAVFFLMC